MNTRQYAIVYVRKILRYMFSNTYPAGPENIQYMSLTPISDHTKFNKPLTENDVASGFVEFCVKAPQISIGIFKKRIKYQSASTTYYKINFRLGISRNLPSKGKRNRPLVNHKPHFYKFFSPFVQQSKTFAGFAPFETFSAAQLTRSLFRIGNEHLHDASNFFRVTIAG